MKPRLLDLFCGAGGAATGYHRAGFDVHGIDIKPQPNYPFPFLKLDAISFLASSHVLEYDAIHASPPCQSFTAYRRKGHGVGDGYPNLIGPVRDLLAQTGLPYVIENVEGAPLHDPLTLCGSSFGLDVQRHRLFEINWSHPDYPTRCNHASQKAKGKRFPGATNRDGRFTCEIGVWRIPLATQKQAMGVDWDVTLEELSEMVPPAYTEQIGRQLLQHLYRSRQTESESRQDEVVAAAHYAQLDSEVYGR